MTAAPSPQAEGGPLTVHGRAVAIACAASLLAGVACKRKKEAPPPPAQVGMGASLPVHLPEVRFHLTARPWRAMHVPREAYLDRMEGIARYEAGLQDGSGRIVDPVIHQEWQYGTPCYAAAVGILASAGRAQDLIPSGQRAMDHVASQMRVGNRAIPQNHGNFFVAPMLDGLAAYGAHAPAERLEAWRKAMRGPIETLVNDRPNTNWRTYAMKGEWYRARQGLVSQRRATDYIEEHWKGTQRHRLSLTRWGLYHDLTSSPDTFAYDALARLNLLQIVTNGYAGPSASEMRRLLQVGGRTSLLLQDASGQAPLGGRSGAHVWNDIVNAACFELMAETSHREGDLALAGQYRRAAMLALQSADRWRSDRGFYYVTKNRFDPALRTRYATYSQLTNYNGNVIYHMGEAYRARRTSIQEQPAPVEIGGYAFEPDEAFAMGFANAGGMQVQMTLRGSARLEYDNYWNALGITRFSRNGWDSRLGPSDGIRDAATGSGMSYAPTFLDQGLWKKLASLPDRYQGRLSVQFAHPLVVRCRIDYTPSRPGTGPSFSDALIVTPDGVLSSLSSDSADFGVTWPILVSDGERELSVQRTTASVSVAFPGSPDRQNFIALSPRPALAVDDSPLRSSYGDLQAVRYTSPSNILRTFVYPQGAGDPEAEAVRRRFRITPDGFSSCLGRVEGTLYVGRTAAGGWGQEIDLDRDGRSDISFTEPCGFVVQLDHGRILAIESDLDVQATIKGRTVMLSAFAPVRFGH